MLIWLAHSGSFVPGIEDADPQAPPATVGPGQILRWNTHPVPALDANGSWDSRGAGRAASGRLPQG
jgi:hypothetical protein